MKIVRPIGLEGAVSLFFRSVVAFFLKCFAAVSSFLVTYYLALSTGVSELGMYYSCVAIVVIVSVFSRFGMDTVLSKIVAATDKNDLNGNVRESFYICSGVVFVSSVLVSIFLYLNASVINDIWFESASFETSLQTFSVSILGLSLLNVNGLYLRGHGRYRASILTQDISLPVFTLLSMLLFVPAYGLYGAALSYTVASAATYLCSTMYIFLWARPSGNGTARLKDIWKESKHLFVGGFVVRAVYPWFPTLLLGALFSSSEVGIYSAANRLSLLVGIVAVSVISVVSPLFGRAYAREEYNRLEYLIKLSGITTAIFVLPLFLTFCIYSEQVLFLFGEEFIPAYYCLIILVIGRSVFAGFGPQGNVLVMTGHANEFKKANLYGAFILVVMCAVLVPWFGSEGAAAAVAIGLIYSGVMFKKFVRRAIPVKTFFFGTIQMDWAKK